MPAIGNLMPTRRRSRGFLTIVVVPATLAASIVCAQTPQEQIQTTELSPETTDIPAPAAEEKPPTAREICTDETSGDAVIDRIRSRLYRLTCSSASWFDGLFGNR